MTPRLANASRITLATLTLLLITIGLISWKQQDGKKQTPQIRQQDTIPSSRERKVRDLDQALNELDNTTLKLQLDQAMASVTEAMKQIDADKLQLEIKKALETVNMEQIKADIDKAMKEIDFEKIQAEIKNSMSKMDWNQLNEELSKARLEIEKAKKIDMAEINRELEKAREEIKKIQPELQKELAKAKVEIEKAKAEVREYKTFVDGLEQDGLLNKKENYTIRHKDGKLTINGKEVPAGIYNKYRNFLDKHEKLFIEKDGNSFNMDNDE